MTYEVSVEQISATPAAVVAGRIPHDEVADFLGRAFGTVMAAVPGSAVTGPPFARYEVTDDGFSIEAGFPVLPGTQAGDGVRLIELPGGTAARTMHVGPYDQVVGAYQAIEAWFGENGRRPTGAPWETYFDEPGVERPRTLVTWPCE